MLNESVPKIDKCFWKCYCIHRTDFYRDIKKTFCGYDSYPDALINSCTAEIRDSVCQMISLLETVVLRKFGNLFHKSFHLSPCVMLSVFKAVSILSPSPTPALLHGLAPSYTKPCCPQTVKHFSEALCGFTLQGKYFVSSFQPFTGMLWQWNEDIRKSTFQFLRRHLL